MKSRKADLPPTHAYCDHVPETWRAASHRGPDGSRVRARVPIAVRLVMEGHGEGGHEIVSLPAKAYPSGSITFGANLEDLGQYALLLETEKDGKLTTAVRIPIHVGGGGGHGSHGGGIGATEIALLVGVAGIRRLFVVASAAECKGILAQQSGLQRSISIV